MALSRMTVLACRRWLGSFSTVGSHRVRQWIRPAESTVLNRLSYGFETLDE